MSRYIALEEIEAWLVDLERLRLALPKPLAAIIHEYADPSADVLIWSSIRALTDGFHRDFIEQIQGLGGCRRGWWCGQPFTRWVGVAPFKVADIMAFGDARLADFDRHVHEPITQLPRMYRAMSARGRAVYTAALYMFICIAQSDMAPISFVMEKSAEHPGYWTQKRGGGGPG